MHYRETFHHIIFIVIVHENKFGMTKQFKDTQWLIGKDRVWLVSTKPMRNLCL